MLDPKTEFDLQIDSNQLKARWIVPATLGYFDGHFPGNPILPAVAIIDASAELIRRVLQRDDVSFKSVKSCKFTSPIVPDALVEIAFEKHGDDEWKFQWATIHKDEMPTPCAQITLLL